MLRRTFLLAVICLPAAAQAQSMGERTGVNSVLGLAPSTPDFVKQVALSDMTEIQSGKLAAGRGNDVVKAFAEQMIAAHTKTSNELKQLVTDAQIQADVPTSLDGSHRSKIEQLNASEQKNFDRDYAALQVSAHTDAVSLFERYANKGDQAQLKIWAGQTLPEIKRHLEMAQQLETQLKVAAEATKG